MEKVTRLTAARMEYAVAVGLAVVSSLLTALSIAVDKVILDDIVDDSGAFLVTSTVTTFAVAAAGAAAFGVSLDVRPDILALFGVIGLIKSLPLYVYFRVIQQADASTVSPIISTQPAITLVLAFVFLGEMLAPLQYGGAALIIGGVIWMTSLRLQDSVFNFGGIRENVFFNGYVLAAVALTIVWSGEAILVKIALIHTGFWTVFLWTNVFAAGIGVLFLARNNTRKTLADIANSTPRQAGALGVSEIIGSIGGGLMIAAYAYGPVSVVAPVLHTYAVFVFLIIIALHLSGFHIDTDTTGRKMTRKALATIATATGIAILAIV